MIKVIAITIKKIIEIKMAITDVFSPFEVFAFYICKLLFCKSSIILDSKSGFK